MKISTLIKSLTEYQEQHGDIDVYLQGATKGEHPTFAEPGFFVVAEEYKRKDGGWCINIRSWPY